MPDHLEKLLKETTVVPAVNQIECHPYFTQPTVQIADSDHGILTQAWSPIGGITSYRGADGARSTFEDPTVAAEHSKTPVQVMLRWGLQRGRSVIPMFAFSGALRWPGGALFRWILLVGASAPSFLLGLLGIIFFYSKLGWLPAAGRGPGTTSPTGFVLIDSVLHADPSQFWSGLQHLLLPGLSLAIAPAIAIGRILRSSIETALGADHVRTARSKGLREIAVLDHHVIRNSLGPALSMSGLQLGGMFAGVVVIEQVFSWPGIGLYLGASLSNADFPAVAGVTLLLGSIYIVVNAVVDVLQTVADPRLTM